MEAASAWILHNHSLESGAVTGAPGVGFINVIPDNLLAAFLSVFPKFVQLGGNGKFDVLEFGTDPGIKGTAGGNFVRAGIIGSQKGDPPAEVFCGRITLFGLVLLFEIVSYNTDNRHPAGRNSSPIIENSNYAYIYR